MPKVITLETIKQYRLAIRWSSDCTVDNLPLWCEVNWIEQLSDGHALITMSNYPETIISTGDYLIKGLEVDRAFLLRSIIAEWLFVETKESRSLGA